MNDPHKFQNILNTLVHIITTHDTTSSSDLDTVSMIRHPGI